jgi:hypothetical protein
LLKTCSSNEAIIRFIHASTPVNQAGAFHRTNASNAPSGRFMNERQTGRLTTSSPPRRMSLASCHLRTADYGFSGAGSVQGPGAGVRA